MKIEEVVKQQRQAQTKDALPTLQKKVLAFFTRHKGEVFSSDDPDMLRELSDGRPSAIGWTIWALEKKNFLAKKKVAKKTYHGLPEDIKKLNSDLK